MFVIAEIGSNWYCGDKEASYHQAHLAIEQAASSGAQAVKFQLFRADKLYSRDRVPSIYERVKKFELPYEWLGRLKEVCTFNNVEFWLSVFDKDSVDAAANYVDGFKVASGDLTNRDLVEYVCKVCGECEIPLIMSTGAATVGEVYESLAWTSGYKLPWVCLMKCVSDYPANMTDYNLSSFLELRDSVDEIGISDHTCDEYATVASLGVTLGYDVFETHVRPVITDYVVEAAESPDWNISLPMTAFKRYVGLLNESYAIVGEGVWSLTEGEMKERLWARRGSDGLRPTDDIRE